jgi:hypothetical protein
LIVGGLTVVLSTPNTAGWAFAGNALLTIGVAIGLIGVVLRVQLDIQDELDVARRAREEFERELRRDVAVIDQRVRQILDELAQRESGQGVANPLMERLLAELAEARDEARRLEEEIVLARRPTPGSRFAGLLAPLMRRERDAVEKAQAQRSTRWRGRVARVAGGFRGVIRLIRRNAGLYLMTLLAVGALFGLTRAFEAVVPAAGRTAYAVHGHTYSYAIVVAVWMVSCGYVAALLLTRTKCSAGLVLMLAASVGLAYTAAITAGFPEIAWLFGRL